MLLFHFSICILLILLIDARQGGGRKYVRFPSGLTLSDYPSRPVNSFPKPEEYLKQVPILAPPRVEYATSEIHRPAPPLPEDNEGQGGTSNTPVYNTQPKIHPQQLKQSSQSGYSSQPNSYNYVDYKTVMMNLAGNSGQQSFEGEGTRADPNTNPSPSSPSLQPPPPPAAVQHRGKEVHLKKSDTNQYIAMLHTKHSHQTKEERQRTLGHTYTTLGGGEFYQNLFGTKKKGFNPLSFFLGGGHGGSNSPFFVPVPIVVPPPPPPPPGPKCYTNPSGFLCCNVTLETTMEKAFQAAKAEGISLCNAQKIAGAVQEAAENKFGMKFESVVGHKDFVAKVNFAGDLNCKIEVDGKFLLAYATPLSEPEVNIIDANSFFSGDADELLDNGNGTDPNKPTYIVYGPIR